MTGVVDQAVDGVAEFAIVPSFTRLGYEARRRTARWDDLNGYDLTGRDILLTGGTSGIGRAAVEQLVRMGATVTFTGRTHETQRTGSRRDRTAYRDVHARPDRRRHG